ncbi:MAG: glycosyltransferase family 2 protein [Candidatus Roizmanbacteria bacterium]
MIKNKIDLTVIIPAYKQSKTIINDVKNIKKVLDSIRYTYEIVIVFDGKVDNSFQKIKQLKLSSVTCIEYTKNQGKFYAIRLGMRYAKGYYVMFLDSGMEIDPSGISMLLQHMDWYQADIIVGSKRHPASLVEYTLSRKILSFGYYWIVRLLFSISVTDTQAGLKLFRLPVLETILPLLVENKFAGDLEMLVVAQQKGFTRIFDSPIKLSYKWSKITSAASLHSIVNILIDTVAIFYRANILHYYDKSQKTTLIETPIKIYKS